MRNLIFSFLAATGLCRLDQAKMDVLKSMGNEQIMQKLVQTHPNILHDKHVDEMDCELIGLGLDDWFDDYEEGIFKVHCTWYDENGEVSYEESYDDKLAYAIEELIINELEVRVAEPLEEILEDYIDDISDFIYDVTDTLEDDLEDNFEEDVEEIEEWIDETLPDVVEWIETSLDTFTDIIEGAARNVTERLEQDAETAAEGLEEWAEGQKEDLEEALNRTSEIVVDSLEQVAEDVQEIGEQLIDEVEEVVSEVNGWINEIRTDLLGQDPTVMVNTARPVPYKGSNPLQTILLAVIAMFALTAVIAISFKDKKEKEVENNEALLTNHIHDDEIVA